MLLIAQQHFTQFAKRIVNNTVRRNTLTR